MPLIVTIVTLVWCTIWYTYLSYTWIGMESFDNWIVVDNEELDKILSIQSTRKVSKNLEVNTSHALIKGLVDLRLKDEEFAKIIVSQIFDNAMIQAGLMTEPRDMVERNYKIMPVQEAIIAVTFRCNAKCAMCEIWKSENKKEVLPSYYFNLQYINVGRKLTPFF